MSAEEKMSRPKETWRRLVIVIFMDTADLESLYTRLPLCLTVLYILTPVVAIFLKGKPIYKPCRRR